MATAARPWTVGIVFPEDDPTCNTPHSLNILIEVPEHIKSMSSLEMELDDIGSKLSLIEVENPGKFSLVVQLPMRIDGDSISAKFRKKRRVIEASARVKTVDEGQPRELLEAVQKQRLKYLNSLKEAEDNNDDREEAAAKNGKAAEQHDDESLKMSTDEKSVKKPEADPALVPNPKALYEKYKRVGERERQEAENSSGSDDSSVVAAASSFPSPPSSQLTDSNSNHTGGYDNTERVVQGHPTNRLQLVSPEALINIVELCLSLALTSKGPAGGGKPQNTVAKVMASFYSQSQSELCRQLLVNLAKSDDITNEGANVVISPVAKEKWVKLAEAQQTKIANVLEEKVKKQQALVELGRASKGGKVEKMSTHAHAPVFDKEDENSEPQLPSRFCPGELIVSAKNSSGCLSTLLTKAFKGSEKRRVKQFVGKKAEVVADKLMDNSFAVMEGFILPPKVVELRSEIDGLQPHFTPSEIWVGKGADVGAQISVPDVRGDKVLWMCGGHKEVDSTLFDSAGVQPKGRGAIEPCEMSVKVALGKSKVGAGGVRKIAASVMGKFGALKQVLESLDKFVFGELTKKDPRLARIASRSDAMLAVYPGGGSRFQKHVDNTANDGRRLTVLLYLNLEGWTEEKGGFLRVWGKDSAKVGPTDVMPLGGRVAMFYSDEVAHEVTAAHDKRYAMTVWYYDGVERNEAVLSAKRLETGDEKGDMEAQAEASAFIKQTLAGEAGEGDLTGKSASAEELRRIGVLASKLSPKAVKIVAGICGAPSEEYFLEAANQLTPESLAELRVGLAKMGVS